MGGGRGFTDRGERHFDEASFGDLGALLADLLFLGDCDLADLLAATSIVEGGREDLGVAAATEAAVGCA